MMKVTFLGTGTSQGVPVIGCRCAACISPDVHDKRLRSSVMVESDDLRIVIDCGPDFRQQMLREQVTSIDAILVTHGHKDHLGGLDDVRAFNYINHRPVDVYASPEVQDSILTEFAYAFGADRYPGVPEINLHTLTDDPFIIKGHTVTPIRARHYDQDHFVYGFRIGHFSYITDAIEIPDEEKHKIEGSEIIVLNALRKQKHYSHFNLEQALALMNEFSPMQGYLTHISHQMGIYHEVSQELPGFVDLAYDGLTVSL
jgi:phosphoribosyl 1,2-cyclic phosphate phosphodiesterase